MVIAPPLMCTYPAACIVVKLLYHVELALKYAPCRRHEQFAFFWVIRSAPRNYLRTCASCSRCTDVGCRRLTKGSGPVSQGGCIIRAKFLDDIKQAYQRDAALENLLMDPFFAENLAQRQESWRRVVSQVCPGS